jgi:hypothetical protein
VSLETGQWAIVILCGVTAFFLHHVLYAKLLD